MAITWNSSNLSSGFYRVYAAIYSPTLQIRYFYVTQPVYVAPDGTAELVTKQWTGDVSVAWSDASNWTPGGVPAGPDDVTIQLPPTDSISAAGMSGASIQLLSGNAGTFRKSAGTGETQINAIPFYNAGNVVAGAGTLSFSSFAQTGGLTSLSGGSMSVGSSLILQGGTVSGTGGRESAPSRATAGFSDTA